MLPRSLTSLLAQDYPGQWRVILVDDHSEDKTGDVARRIASAKCQAERLTVINAPDLPEGWSGKVAAMQAGISQSTSDYVLFTDADISHPPESLRRLMANAIMDKTDINSLMVKLNCESFAEKLLIPAFVFFFSMLYPFHLVNGMTSRIAAAAGGVMLVKRETLDKRGGLEQIKSALIDDCALANLIKNDDKDHNHGCIRLTLATDVLSLRSYPKIADVWNMVARSAFTQLRYSRLLLAATVLGLGLLFIWPMLMIFVGGMGGAITGLIVWMVMSILYLPMTQFYDRPLGWAFTLPIAGAIYLAATIDSAGRYWHGNGGVWKGRAQAR